MTDTTELPEKEEKYIKNKILKFKLFNQRSNSDVEDPSRIRLRRMQYLYSEEVSQLAECDMNIQAFLL
jgi:hypothetical protein